MNALIKNWIEAMRLAAGSVSVISLLTLIKRKDLFMRIMGDTNRSYYKAWSKCLPSVTPEEITGNHRPVNLIIDRQKMSLGVQDLIPILEVLQLSGAKEILEIGTSNGATTWHLAANAVHEASITTVDLPPDISYTKYSPSKLSTSRPTKDELGFCFHGTPEEERITQVLVDSKNLIGKIGNKKFDLIFIDGAHTYEYAAHDTETALKLIKRTGYIIWHDYFVFRPSYGVMIYLNELNQKMAVYHLYDSVCGIARIDG